MNSVQFHNCAACVKYTSSCFLSVRASQACGHCVHPVACRLHHLLSSSRANELLVFFHTPNSNTCKHTNVHLFTGCLSVSSCLSHTHGKYKRLPHPSSGASVSPPSFFFFHFSTSALSSLTSSCVIQQRNISSTRPAINMSAHPRLLGLLFFL